MEFDLDELVERTLAQLREEFPQGLTPVGGAAMEHSQRRNLRMVRRTVEITLKLLTEPPSKEGA
jgi:hypothetical protein